MRAPGGEPRTVGSDLLDLRRVGADDHASNADGPLITAELSGAVAWDPAAPTDTRSRRAVETWAYLALASPDGPCHEHRGARHGQPR